MLVQREDDKEGTVMSRLKTYHEQTEPIIEYFKNKGRVICVEGRNEVHDTTAEIFKKLGIN